MSPRPILSHAVRDALLGLTGALVALVVFYVWVLASLALGPLPPGAALTPELFPAVARLALEPIRSYGWLPASFGALALVLLSFLARRASRSRPITFAVLAGIGVAGTAYFVALVAHPLLDLTLYERSSLFVVAGLSGLVAGLIVHHRSRAALESVA